MSATVATKDAVYRAADAIARRGEVPSTIVIQEITGGSYTTVGKHLDAWETQRALEAAPKLPAEAEQLVRRTGQALWSLLDELATKRIRDAQAKADEAVAKMEEKLKFAQLDLQNAESKLGSAVAAGQAAEADLKESRSKCDGLEASLLALQSECGALGARVEDAMRTNSDLIKELGAARSNAGQKAVS